MKKSLLLILVMVLSFQAFSEEAMEMGNVMSESNQLIQLDRTKYIAGGLATVFLGFGTGHAIQGRYKEKGWIFTASSVILTVGSVGYLANVYKTVKDIDASNKKESVKKVDSLTTISYVYIGLAVVGLGVRFWELFDVWMLPAKYKLVDQNSFEFKPLAFYSPETKFNYGLSLNYKF